MNKKRLIATLAAIFGATAAQAVSLGADGTGQALIYPYYTVRAVEGGQFNTYLSVLNSTRDAKAVRVNVREARMGKAVASFNLFLSPNDMWTAAIVPTAEGARMITSDTSCVEPASGALEFHNRNFSAANADGAGDSLDRVREGYVEMLEMATLTGAGAAAVTHTSAGPPANCAVVQPPFAVEVTPPNGGLSGTLTVIDVLRGMDFTVNADALEDLAQQPYFRVAGDPYPDFNAAEIEPVSRILHAGQLYRSRWARGQDAVSAVLLRFPMAEYVLDQPTRSLTDIVFTMPTWRFNVGQASPPFLRPARWAPYCTDGTVPVGETMRYVAFNREERGAASFGSGFPEAPPGTRSFALCAAAVAATVTNDASHMPQARENSAVLGYAGKGSFGGSIAAGSTMPVVPIMTSGWLMPAPDSSFTSNIPPPLVSLATSSRLDLRSGAETSGAHSFSGWPIVGFSVRTFRNGTLDCDGQACQGNFGGAFTFRYRRSLSP